MLKGCQDYRPVGPITFVINYDKFLQAAAWSVQCRYWDSFLSPYSPLFSLLQLFLARGTVPCGMIVIWYIYIAAADSDNRETITSSLAALGTRRHQGVWPITRNKHTPMDCIL